MIDKIIERLKLDTYWIERDYTPRHIVVPSEPAIDIEDIPLVDIEINKALTQQDIKELSAQYDLEIPILQSFIKVESSGKGFNSDGRLIIQFEPHYFRRNEPNAKNTGVWNTNKVDVQSKEWIAFNDAYRINPDSAMKSASIGLMQVMGQHYAMLGFNNVGSMWDFAKASERNQLELGLMFIKSHPKLYQALKNKDWYWVAYYYNGSGFEAQAKRYKIIPYDKQLKTAYEYFSKN